MLRWSCLPRYSAQRVPDSPLSIDPALVLDATCDSIILPLPAMLAPDHSPTEVQLQCLGRLLCTFLGLLLCSAFLLVHLAAKSRKVCVLDRVHDVVYLHHRLQASPQVLRLRARALFQTGPHKVLTYIRRTLFNRQHLKTADAAPAFHLNMPPPPGLLCDWKSSLTKGSFSSTRLSMPPIVISLTLAHRIRHCEVLPVEQPWTSSHQCSCPRTRLPAL